MRVRLRMIIVLEAAPTASGMIMTQMMIRAFRASAALAGLALSLAAPAAAEPQDPWPSIASDIFGARPVEPAAGLVALEAPTRAEDASLTPMTLRFAAPEQAAKATLVIDQNPAPLAAAFTLGEKSAVGFIETRVRVNFYSNVHAVLETRAGALRADVKFVKASGGCSAPAGKGLDEANAHLGEMKYRAFKSPAPGRREAQIMIRHPNNSGMQMDQITHLFIPAHYIDRVEVRQGSDLIFTMEGGISLSENPAFRFDYAPTGAKTLTVEAHDSKGGVFKGEWPIEDAS